MGMLREGHWFPIVIDVPITTYVIAVVTYLFIYWTWKAAWAVPQDKLKKDSLVNIALWEKVKSATFILVTNRDKRLPTIILPEIKGIPLVCQITNKKNGQMEVKREQQVHVKTVHRVLVSLHHRPLGSVAAAPLHRD